jgi:ferric-dicitrate binding protein FerR (iron transport regulator)
VPDHRPSTRRPRRHLAAITIALGLLVPAAGAATAQTGDTTSDTTSDTVPTVTVNEFLPTDRDLSECLSALPRPGCGSEARGGWRQTAIFVAMLGGLAFIGWRIVVSSRRARAALATGAPRDDSPA